MPAISSSKGLRTDSPQACLAVPASALSRAGFNRWVQSGQVPDGCQLSWVDGTLLIDMSPEEIESHNKLKTEITRVIATLVKQRRLGEFFSDRTLITNEQADLSTEPDAMFVSLASLRTGRVRKQRSASGLITSLVGTPDWVVELVSKTSITKDTRYLKQAYRAAGVSEYWLIDARKQQMRMQVFTLAKSGYQSVPVKRGRWVSPLFGDEFHLWRVKDEFGFWEYTLEHESGR
jgi:Uma2 family endonuclease